MAYTNLTASFVYKALLTYTLMDQLAENTTANLLPSGTVMFFYQASVPAGWTKNLTNDDTTLRIVSGAGGGTGGTDGIESPPTHTHTLAHTHTLPAGSDAATGGAQGSLTTGASSAETFSAVVGFSPKYIDVVMGVKDSEYTNLDSTFRYMTFLTATLMDQLATNTSNNHFPSGTKMAFVQVAAPTGWTKKTDDNDATLRIESGSGGGSGGTDSISAPPTHAHTNSHGHTLGGGAPLLKTIGGYWATSTGAASSNPGSSTGFSPKYVDAIIASKDA